MSIASVEGKFTNTGVSDWVVLKGPFNFSVAGGVGTVKLEKSYDRGVTVFDVSKNANGDPASYALNNSEHSLIGDEPESDVYYRVNCTSYTTDIDYRLSQ